MNRIELVIEEVIGNRAGSRVYCAWVESLALRGDERVYEIGTGGGACARHLASVLPSGHLTCLDVDTGWLSVARRRLVGFGSRVEFVAADAACWERPDWFDVAVAHFVLHDIPASHRAAALRRAALSLKSHGRLCVREPIGHGMSHEELHAQLRDAGFSPVGHERRERLPLMGETVSGVWRMSARGAQD